jgi:GAF domain-containing protein
MLATPMVREGKSVGAILIRRLEVRPFTDNQVSLLKNFADQAVMAIENVRLFQESQSRNRDLTEALEQQTATSEILGVIASSPTDLQPVLDVVAENAARLCDADDALILRVEADVLRLIASYGSLPTSQTRPINRQVASGRAVIDRQTIHVHDISLAEEEFPVTRARGIPRGIRTFLVTPLLCKGDPIGAIVIRRTQVRPFSEKQIALLKTFADQAVIAIENVRLFQELQARNRELGEALEQQTATSEILGVIASSPTDIQPVLNAVTENAARLCDATDAQIRLVDGNMLQHVAAYGPMRATPSRVISRGFTGGRAIVDRRTIHIHDLEAVREVEYPETPIHGYRTVLAVPLLRKDTPIGVINIRRLEVRPFSDKQIKLLETFADQAVIAIENVRLFQELKESLERQTATSEILCHRQFADRYSTGTDVVAENAARLCGCKRRSIWRADGDKFWLVACMDRSQFTGGRNLDR